MNKLSLCDFFNNIPFVSGIHYISVGCAELNPDHTQQYPPFIQQIKKDYPSTSITIILIDPLLQDIPYCITEQLKNYKWSTPKYDNIFISDRNEITIYQFKECVDWLPDEKSINSTNIYTGLLKYQNKIIKDGNSLLFFHDFTGRDTGELAVIMDPTLGDNKKYVMYDISVRQNEGCYIKLDSSDNMPIIRIDNRPEIINPYNIPDVFNAITVLKKEKKNIDSIIKQLIIVIKNKIVEWDTNVSLYRQMLSQDAKINNLNMTILNKECNKDVKDAYVIYQTSLQKEHLDYCINLSRNLIIINLRNILDMMSNNNDEKNKYIQNCELQLSSNQINLYVWVNEVKDYLHNKLLLL